MNRPWADVHETHIGAVFLVGDLAYKLKKPVDLGFLDFSARKTRERVCHREVELNRRLAPDVYLGVADVTGPDGEVLDHLVVMRRMPEDRRLSALVRRRAPLSLAIRRLARQLAAFHSRAARGPEIDADETRDAVRDRWRDSFEQVRPFHGAVLDPATALEIEALAEEFLAGREPLFERRIAEGHVVDGHGDLLADDVFCLDDGPRVLDCLEFDDRLRHVDVLDDVAFLAMDLERLDAPELGAQLLLDYREFSGDPAPPALVHHYLAYRAFVRVKVACLRHAQGDPEAAALAREYAELTLWHLRLGRVRLVLVGGEPGTGKSTIAGGLADRLGATLLQSDRLRKELAGLAPVRRPAEGYRQGLYDAGHTDATYAELVRRAGELLALGEFVVLDASWNAARHRALAAEVAGRTDTPLLAVRCQAPEETAARRITTRSGALSDATPEIAHRMAADADPWPEAHPLPTTGTPAETLARAVAALVPEHRKSPGQRHSDSPGARRRGAKVEPEDTHDPEEGR
ncbi:aminoglycoside phosphotransferase family enzyme/predicted kinase [Amycolatopsis lexingtonensis]|uniref:Aminoglycoside phosphotransferase family enzyme/predicted kinase n=1 Tax=Amycolatopsis lexingtonensis TaxID=218822 RepID=A0ABR9HXL8_9PSEU|nr:AAA family ATPase [Amycolatopsis lexingtonensis]MBE1495650.1 aminoglycoside phosphotransferase family enzyme/predicted kinase [Amycolatopsis lexingtonensis]